MKRAMIGLMLALAAPAVAAPATPAADAKAFVEGIYRPWLAALKRGSAMYQPPRDGRVFVAEMAALLKQNERISNRTGDVGEIDWVILCSW